MRLMLAMIVLLPALRQDPTPAPKGCDLEKIVKMTHCAECERFDPPLDPKGKCGSCDNVPKSIDACVKSIYWCSRCGKSTGKSGSCCEIPLNEFPACAVTAFKCEKCGVEGEKEGDCAVEACKAEAKRIVRVCLNSGKWPHGGSTPAPAGGSAPPKKAPGPPKSDK